jgi:transposase
MVNVRAVERDQQFLMPPSVSDWLPEDHLAWFVIDLVAELDLAGLYASLRADGRGGVSYHPEMMLAVLLYAYCVGERSSRRIERRLIEDVAFRVVAANQCPDHATLARFRARHRGAIAGLFSQVLGLCVAEGLVDTGVVAIDSTKMEADASSWSNRTRRRIVEEILDDAEAVDSAEDEAFGDRRGDELPDKWAGRSDRRSRLREALRQLDETAGRGKVRDANTTDPDSRRQRTRTGFVQGYNAQAAVSEDHIVVAADVVNAGNDAQQLTPMIETVEQNLTAGQVGVYVADAGYWSTENLNHLDDKTVLIKPRATPGENKNPKRNSSEHVKILNQVDAGEITAEKAAETLGVSTARIQTLLTHHHSGITTPAQAKAQMQQRLATTTGAAAYAKRKTTVEPVFGNLKANLGFRRFSQRGLDAVRAEWQFACTIHNLLKLHRHQLATT